MITAFWLFAGAIAVMVVLGGLGMLGGYLHARAKERAYLKVFNEDVQRPIMPRGVS